MTTNQELKKEVEILAEEVSRLVSENMSLKAQNNKELKNKDALRCEISSLKERLAIEIQLKQNAEETEKVLKEKIKKLEADIVKMVDNLEKELKKRDERSVDIVHSLKEDNESLNNQMYRLIEASKEHSLEKQRAVKKHEMLKRELASLKKSIINILIK